MTTTPKTFYLAGSNDGNNWSLIDNETLSNYNSNLNSYASTNNQAFLYFRLIISNNFGGSHVQVVDWQIYGNVSVQVVDTAGITGQFGFTGLMGALGFTGWFGSTGYSGESGWSGTTGYTGWSGTTGPTGSFTGCTGVSGTTGEMGIIGFTGISGETGKDGPLPVNKIKNENDTLFLDTTGSSGQTGGTGFSGSSGYTGFFGPTFVLTGCTGSTGITGFQGSFYTTGHSGDTGISGRTGVSGLSGETGMTGSFSIHSGSTGWEGSTGFTGVDGIMGTTGYGYNYGLIGSTGLIGDTGSSGTTGLTGETGFTGEFGITGGTGFTGSSGQQGISFFTGDTGVLNCGVLDSFSGICCDNTGPTGHSGTTGWTGYSGASGWTGYSGPTGSMYTGVSGFIGFTGITGIIGILGITGVQGQTGYTGVLGLVGWTGSQMISIPETFEGENPNIPASNFNPTGYAGFQGYVGPNGDIKMIGNTGESGIIGSSGSSGESGIIGRSGSSGSSGESGITGSSGSSGSYGESGITGWCGSSGVIGVSGVSGGSGWTGNSGFTGDSGVSGYIGLTGEDGYDGMTGYVGDIGPTGRTGTMGETGVTGYSGWSGITGLDANQNSTGYTGIMGSSGSMGETGRTGGLGETGGTGGLGETGGTGVVGYSGRTGWTGVVGYYSVSGTTGMTGLTGYTGFDGVVGDFEWGTEYLLSTLNVQDDIQYTKPVFTKTLAAGWIRDGTSNIQGRLEGGLPRVELVYGLNVGSDIGGGGNDILITLAKDASGNSGVSRSLDGKQYTYPFNALSISGGVVPSNIFWDGLKWILTPSMSYSYDGIQFYMNDNSYGIVSIAIGGRRLGSGNGEGKNLYIGIGTAGIYQSFDGFHWYLISTILTASVGARVIWYGEKWLATGVEGIAQGSSDGLTWTLVSSATFAGTGGGLDLVWSGERWLAVGASVSKSGTIMATSLDATSWTVVDISYVLVAYPVFGQGHEISLEWNGQVFMMTLTSSVGIYPLWYSLNGLSWSVSNGNLNSSGLSLERVRWNGSRFLAVGSYNSTGVIVRSLNGGSSYSPMPYTLMMKPSNSSPLTDIFHIEYSSNRSIHSLRFPFSETLALGSRNNGGGGVVGRSLDEGLTWAWIDISNVLTYIQCGAWNGNRWLIGGYGGNNSNTLATGMDGTQWTSCGSRYLDVGVYSIGWSNELHIWVAGGISSSLQSGLIYCTSILGIYFIPALWTSSVSISSVGSVVWNGIIWIVTPLNSGTIVGYSLDGKLWTGIDLSGVLTTISTSAQWNGAYWWMGVVNSSGISSLAKSSNGITWIVDGLFTDASGNHGILDQILSTSETDIALATTVSGGIWYSLGAYNDWNRPVVTGGSGIIRGGVMNWNEAVFVVGDLSGQLWVSPNGIQWQYSRTFFDTSNSIVNAILWNQPRSGYAFLQTILVASGIRNGGGGELAYSYDGIQWYSCASGAGGLNVRINGISYGGKVWVAVGLGSGGWIATSFNGRIWTGTVFGVQVGVESFMYEGYDITWNGTIFLAVGVDVSGGGVMASSLDGYSWKIIPQSFGGGGYVNSITWTGRTWIAYVNGGDSTTYICNDVYAVNGWQSTNPPNTYLMDASSVFLTNGNGTYFTSPSSTIPGITYSSSYSISGHEPYHAFDGLYYWNNGVWKTEDKYDISSGVYSHVVSTTGIVGLGTVLGDWIELDLSSSAVIREYYVAVDLSSNELEKTNQKRVTRNGGSIPSNWLVVGSNNGGTTWNVLDSFDWYNSDGVAGNNGVVGGYTFVIRNIFNNTTAYTRYRLIIERVFAYPGQTGPKIPGSILEWDLMVANSATYQVSRFARPIPTPSGLVLFSNGAYRGASGQPLMLVSLGDLSGGVVDSDYNVSGFVGPVSSVLNGLTGIMTGVAFDGYRFAVGDVCGNVVYLANMEGAGYGMQWQNRLNGNVLVSGLSSIYDACSIDGRMCFGGIVGSGGSPIMYTTMESGDAVFKPSNNAGNIFSYVTGLSSNEGKGSVYVPNYVWVDKSELFRVMGPRWYDQSAETVSLTIDSIANTSLLNAL